MTKKITAFLIILMISISNLLCSAVTITDENHGLVANNVASISYSLNMDKNTFEGTCIIQSTEHPFNNKIILKGSFRHVKDLDVPHYPLYKGSLNATTGSGKSLGKWTVEIDTRMGSIVGKWTYNGKTYNVEFEDNY